MIKKTYKHVTLHCVMQKSEFPKIKTSHTNQKRDKKSEDASPVRSGVLSINTSNGSFRFEEEFKKPRPKRNPKLFDGQYCSLVHMQNGKYQIHMKTIKATSITDRNELAFRVYCDLVNALKIIE